MGLDASGVVWAWGENASGQLGDGSNQSRLYPVKVIEPSDRSGLLTGITALDAGNGYWLEFGGHTLALKADGSAWAWGHNAAGQLGDDTQISRSHAVPVLGLSGVSALATGFDHSLAAKSADGSVWGWGYNYYGQVGDGTLIDRHTPVPVREITNVTALAGGRYHSLALKGDGTVWAWGGNGSGQLGNGAWGGAAEAPPTQSVYAHDTSIPLTGMTAIAAGANHSLALRSDRTVWSWGDNGEGQLGDGTWGVIGDWGENAAVQVIDPSDPSGKLSGVVAIAAGTKHSLAVKEDGTVWAWGANNWGQLGDGTLERKHTPTQVSGLTDIASVGAGNGHSLAIGDPPSVAWAWGGNWSGQLGDGTYEQRTTPVQVAFLPEEHGLLKVIGPYYVTPGEELANVVRVENVLDEPLVDVVVLFHLSSDFTYLSSTQDGTYLEQPHRVFWLLGDIAPEETVYAAVNLMVDWDLPEHLTGSMNVELGTQNLEASFDVQAYLDYESALVGEQQLTATEIAEALAADSLMAELMSYSEEMGFESYEVAKRFEYRDGSSIIVLVLLNQDQQSLAILTSDGSRAYVESFDGTVYRIFDLNGGYIEELATGILAPFGSWTDSPLNQPLSAAAATLLSKVPRAVTVPKNYSTCLRNCVLMQGVDYLAGKISSVWSTIKAMGRMDACLHLSDPKKRFRACQDVANEVAKMSDLGKAAVGISRCFPDCNDPAKLGEYVCERELIRCASKNTKEQWYDSAWYWIGRRFDTKFERRAIFSYGCNVETGAWHLVAARLHCDRSPSYLCEVNDRCRNDPDKQAIVDRCCVEDPCDPAATKFTEDGREDACEPIDTESVVAMDPNEKVVDWRGDVVPGQPLSYTVHYENIGAGTAFGVYITDELSVNLDAASLVVNDGGHYLSAIRRLSWNLGELASGQGGAVSFSVDVLDSVPIGSEIINFATVYFPSVPEITPTNAVVHLVGDIAAEALEYETTGSAPVDITLGGSGAGILSFTVTENPLQGKLEGVPPLLTYTATEGFSGQDRLSYIVDSGVVTSNPAQVVILVSPDPADVSPPTVTATYPVAGAVDVFFGTVPVATDTDVYLPVLRAQFSEPLDNETVTDATFTVDGVGGSVLYDEASWTAQFRSDESLAHSTSYTARLQPAVTDAVGNSLGSEYVWQFTTVSPANITVTLPDDADLLDFGAMVVGETSPERLVTVTSSGSLSLVVSNATLTGAAPQSFGITEDACTGISLAPNESCILKVVFEPSTLEAMAATLEIASNDEDAPRVSVDLRGVGTSGGPLADIDGNGASDALTDGILLIRRLFGFSGEPLTKDAVAPDATRSAAEIEALIEAHRDDFDVDGNGLSDALTDGILFVRYLFGFRGEPLISAAIGAGATRQTATQIEDYLATLVQ